MTPRSPARVLCLLALLDLIVCDTQPSNKPVYGGLNQNVTFRIEKSTAFKEILWKKGKNKVIEWEESVYQEPRSFPPFTNRTHLDTKTGYLTIFNVTLSDEDEYEVEFDTAKDSIKFILKVLAPLPPLTLNCTPTDEDVIIRCKLNEPYQADEYLVNYTWECPAGKCKSDTASHEVYLKKNDLPENITCVARNPVFEMKSPFVPSTCVPEKLRNRWLLIPFMLPTMLLLIGCYIYIRGVWIDRTLCNRCTGTS